MANVYVRSGAGGTADGSSWTNAYLTLAAALTAKAAGDDFWVSEDHAETQASAMTLTAPGTAASPNRIICVNHAGTVPPVSADLRTTGTITTTSGNSINFAGFAYCYGLTFNCGSGNNTVSLNWNSTSSWWWRLELCTLKLVTIGAGARIQVGSTVTPRDGLLELINTTTSFANAGQGFALSGQLRWLYTTSAVAGTIPTSLFICASNPAGWLECYGVDLSALGSGKNLFSVGFNTWTEFNITNCKLGASVNITTGAISGQGGIVGWITNSDSGNTNYAYTKQNYQGTISTETTIVRSSGASDGTTSMSRKMVSTANSKLYSPLESDPIIFWNESLSAVTVTVPVVNDGVTLKNNDAWIEVEELGTSSFPQSVLQTCRSADVLATGSNQPTDGTSTWTTTGLTTPIKQSLTVTFTPTGKGPIRCRVMLARASTTMYFDPLIN